MRLTCDGTVEAGLEGDAAAVETLIAWMRVGPPSARVTDAVVVEEPPTGEQGFVVRLNGAVRLVATAGAWGVDSHPRTVGRWRNG